MNRNRFLCATAVMSLALPASDLAVGRETPNGADMVILDAKVWTGKATNHDSQFTALAIEDGRISAVGNDDQVKSRIGTNTEVLQAGGRRVIPGMTDSHTHLISGGFHLDRVNLRNVGSKNEFVERVRQAARKKKAGEWLVGGRWSIESWQKPSQPLRDWLDSVTGDVCTYLSRMDGHQALVNSAALKLAGIDENGPPDPPGGEIERDPKTRRPTGILKESAAGLVSKLIPDPSFDQRSRALQRAMHHANAHGITSIHDMSDPDDLAVFKKAHDDKTLTLRITSYPQFEDWHARAEWIRQFPVKDEWLTIAGVKAYMDGSMGSRTAYMTEPFEDATAQTRYPRGQLTKDAADHAKFQQNVLDIHQQGLQMAVHAIGDQANHLLLNAYQKAGTRMDGQAAGHRIEHAQHLLVGDIPRFARLGVVPSMQPLHKADDGRYAESVLGPARLKGSYAYRQLLDGGALLVFGSDWPVVSLDPFLGIHAAVTAETLAGKVWLPQHSLTRREALLAYTAWPTQAIGRERKLGRLEPGLLADLVILNHDVLQVPPEKIKSVSVFLTIIGGNIVYGPNTEG